MRRALFGELDARLSVPRHATPAPVAAPPPPALSFEGWAELSVDFCELPEAALVEALTARSLTLPVWKQLDDAYRRLLSDDLRAGLSARPAIYEARYREARLRRTRALAEGTPPAPHMPTVAPADLRGTNAAPDLPAAVMEAMGRMPFVPPAPAPAAPQKRPVKTAQSMKVRRPVGKDTMDLDAALQRPTPNLPFAGSPGGTAVVYVPALGPRHYVALQAELALKPLPREETLRRYQVPNEAALRALEEHWRHPAQRAELETALADFAIVLRGQVLR